ncbi:type II toxin-antitoxin system HicA family toxin [Polymorphospora lycopeni]|uniref:Type II toxin-antitoxin system HicA family toxin n=1 Tax=Polymorphospora lycopeni TaxID=3140240 RepID=A0ABV5CL22_9ACTN
MRAREVNQRIERLGGTMLRQRGSHRIYRATNGTTTAQTVVPQHAGDIPNGTLKSIEKALEPVFGKGWLQ